MKVSRFAVKHPVVISMILIVLATFGILSVTTMNVAFMSNVSMPSISVISIYPGAGAEDIEEDITNVLEEDFVTLSGFKSITSTSASSVSIVTVSFQDDIDPYEQLPEVRNRITQKMADLPEGIEGTPTTMIEGADMLPVLIFSVTGGEDVVRLTNYITDIIKPQLTGIPYVSDIYIIGGKELQLNVKLRIADVTAKNISVTDVYQALNYGNVKLPIGRAKYEQHTIDIRYDGSFTSIEDIENLPVGMGDNNIIIRLKDVADISLGYPEPEIVASDGEKEIVVVNVNKRSDGNVVDIVRAVKKILSESEAETQGAVKYEIVSDDSRTVEASISTVIQSGLLGISMAILILFLFLSDSRATFIIGISIPLSLLFTFIGMKFMGLGLNLMTLTGMVVALGMIVDGSIVMIEQVYRYYREKNSDGTMAFSVEEAIFVGSDEVGSSIFASAATTIVVFFPIAMLSGIIGMILKDVAVTLILTLIASLLSALIVVPFLLKQMLRKEGPKEKPISLFNRGIEKLESLYKKALAWSFSANKFILVLAVILLILSAFLVQALGIAFIPATDNSDFYAAIEFPVGQSLEETEIQMMKVKRLIEKNIPEIQTAVFFSGSANQISFRKSENEGYAHVVLVPVAERKRKVQTIILEVQNLLSSSIPGAKVTVTNGGFDRLLGYVSGGTGYGITLVSENMELLYSEANRLQEFLKTDPSVVTANLDTSFDSTTFVIDMNHEYMNSLGVTSYEAGLTSAVLFQGIDAGRFTYSKNKKRYDIHLFSDITDNPVTQDTLSNINVKSATGHPVSFAVMANPRTEQSVSEINHTDRAKTITISTTLVSEDTSGVSSRMKKYLEQYPLTRGVRSQTGGIMELIEDSIPRMLTALFVAGFLVYTVMVLQFERFRQPLLIMGTIPFCFIGVVVSLLVFGSTMSLLSLMGIITLMGIVVNNGIILIDYINILRRRSSSLCNETKKSLAENIITGSSSRIRPILMTTLSTMLGVIPMAVSQGEGSEIYASLGQAIAGGLLTSSLITLFIIPMLYYTSESRHLMKEGEQPPKGEGDAKPPQGKISKSGLYHKALSKLVCVLALGICITNSTSLYGQESTTYTYDTLLEAVYNQNTELRKGQEEYIQSTIDIKDAKANFHPIIDLGFSASYLYNYPMTDMIISFEELFKDASPQLSALLPPGDFVVEDFPNNKLGLSLSLQQPIFLWGKVSKSVKLYKTVADIRSIQLQDLKNKLTAELKTRLTALHYLQSILAELSLQHKNAQKLVTLTEQGLEKGVLLPQDLFGARMEAKEVNVTSAVIQNKISNILLRLQAMTGIKDLSVESILYTPRNIKGNTFSPTEFLAYDRNTLTVKALSQERDVIHAARLVSTAAQIADSISSSNMYWKPDIALQARVEYGDSIQSFRDDGFADTDKLSATISVGIKTTLWDGGKKINSKKRTESKTAVAAIELEQVELSIGQTLNEQLNTITLSNAYIEYQKAKISTVEQRIKQQELLFKAGSGAESDLLESNIELGTARIEMFQQQINLYGAGYTIEYLLGE